MRLAPGHFFAGSSHAFAFRAGCPNYTGTENRVNLTSQAVWREDRKASGESSSISDCPNIMIVDATLDAFHLTLPTPNS